MEGCTKSFFRDSHLKAHMLSHSSEKTLQCAHCAKGFNTRQHLHRHEKTHFPTMECTYEGCDAKFRRQSQLRKHISDVHTMSKRFKCPHEGCARDFNHQSRMDMHIFKKHSAVPRYHCSHENCDEKLFTWSALQAHIKTNHKRIPCDLCGKLCAGPAAIAEHAKEVHGDLSLAIGWQCLEPECTFSCENSMKLLSHYQRIHGYVPEKLTSDIGAAVIDHSNQIEQLTTPHSIISSAASTPTGQPGDHLVHEFYLNRAVSAEPIDNRFHQMGQQKMAIKGINIIDIITGAGYENGRELICPADNCPYRFSRAYDLDRHVQSMHPDIHSPASVTSSSGSHNLVGAPSGLEDFHVVDAEDHGEISIIDPMILGENTHHHNDGSLVKQEHIDHDVAVAL